MSIGETVTSPDDSTLWTFEEIGRLISESGNPTETLTNIVNLIQGRFATGSLWRTRRRFRNKAVGMYLCVGMTRTLVILLLTLRILASPLAMRPESPRTPANYRVVTRICAWPAQRPQRCLSATSLVPYFGGRFPESAEGRGSSYGPQHQRSLTRATLSRLNSPALRGRCSGQLTVCLRC